VPPPGVRRRRAVRLLSTFSTCSSCSSKLERRAKLLEPRRMNTPGWGEGGVLPRDGAPPARARRTEEIHEKSQCSGMMGWRSVDGWIA